MYKVSIVVPIYNMEKYFDECIQSILNQTLKDIEIICVDDGSKDKSLQLVKKYAEKDNRIKIIQKDNSGYGDSVNKGIEAAKGEYIGIVEPDDYIASEMMYVLYDIAKKNDLDVISSNHIRFYNQDEHRIFREEVITYNSKLYGQVWNPSKDKEVFLGNYLNPTGLFKREFLEKENIRHNTTQGASYQDLGFCFQVLALANRMMLVDKAFYYYRQDNPNSSIASKGKMDCVIEEYRYIYEILKGKNRLSMFLPEYCRRKFGSYLYTFERLSWDLKKEFLNKISLEFLNAKNVGELDISLFSLTWRTYIEIIMKDPTQFYEDFLGLSNEVHEKIKNCDKFVIYGAGVIGKRIYNGLFEEDRKKLLGFCVTSTEDNSEFYKETEICTIDAYKRMKDDIAVVIGVAPKHRNEVLDLLRKSGFKNIVILNSVGANT